MTATPKAFHSPFTTFCEGPEDIEKGYRLFYHFHRRNFTQQFLDHLFNDAPQPSGALPFCTGVQHTDCSCIIFAGFFNEPYKGFDKPISDRFVTLG